MNDYLIPITVNELPNIEDLGQKQGMFILPNGSININKQNGEWFTIPNSSNAVISQIQGEALPVNSPTVWEDGDADLFERYVVKTAGTYTYYKDEENNSIVFSQEELDANFAEIWVSNGIAQKVLSVKPKALEIDLERQILGDRGEGGEEIIPVETFVGTTDFSSTATGSASPILIVLDKFKVPYDSYLREIQIKSNGTNIIVKRYKLINDTMFFQDQYSWNKNVGLSMIKVDTDPNLQTGAGVDWKWEKDDIIVLYGASFHNSPNAIGRINEIKYSTTLGNSSSNFNHSSLRASQPNLGLLVNFTFENIGSGESAHIDGIAKSDMNEAEDFDILTKKALLPFLVKNGSIFERENYQFFYDEDNGAITYNTEHGHVGVNGGLKYFEKVGNVIDWDLKPTSVIKKNWNATFETTDANGYNFTLPNSPWARLQFGNQHTLNYHEEILDFKINTINNSSCYIGILDDGVTQYSRKMGHAVVFFPKNQDFKILETQGVDTKSFSVKAVGNISDAISVDDEVRIVKRFNGKTITGALYIKKESNYIKLSELTYSYGLGKNRPSHRMTSIFARNISATVKSFKHNSYEPKKAKILFLGDSNQSGFGTTDYEKTYPRLTQRYVGNAISNRSGSGGTTEDNLAMISEMLERSPEKVILALGLNDIRYNISDLKTKYQSIVSQFESVGTEVIVCKLLPNNSTDVTSFNNWIDSEFTNSNSIVDFYTDFVGENTSLNPLYDSGDGTHPNDLGTKLMFEKLKKYL